MSERIAVVGAGLMGHGIAQVFAAAGHDVIVTDAVVETLGTVATRVAANLERLGADPLPVVARITTEASLACRKNFRRDGGSVRDQLNARDTTFGDYRTKKS